jgi:hypothetical protein
MKNVESILTTGLRMPGTKDNKGNVIEIPSGHIPKNVEVLGIKNWAEAIFVSPSPYYASDPVYAE